MKKNWTTTKLIAIGALSTAWFLVYLTLYSPLLSASGSALTGIISQLFSPFFAIFASLTVSTFGTATIFSIFRGILVLPTSSVLPKPINFITQLIIGLVLDILFKIFHKKLKIFSLLGGITYVVITGLATVLLYFSMGLSTAKNLPSFITRPPGLILLIALGSLLGGLFGLFGYMIYRKIEKTTVVQRIQQ